MTVSNYDKLREITLKQTYHFKGRIINLRVDDVALSDGSTTIREIVEHPGGVCVAALTRDGKLPFYRAGKRYKFKVSEVDDWLRKGKITE